MGFVPGFGVAWPDASRNGVLRASDARERRTTAPRLESRALGARRFIVNWEDVARHLLERAERELGEAKGDETAAALLAELRGYAGSSERQRPSSSVTAADLLLPIHIRKGDLELRIFSTIMTLGTPRDVTLQELRIERFFQPTTRRRRPGAG